jgi:hypothetical protein
MGLIRNTASLVLTCAELSNGVRVYHGPTGVTYSHVCCWAQRLVVEWPLLECRYTGNLVSDQSGRLRPNAGKPMDPVGSSPQTVKGCDVPSPQHGPDFSRQTKTANRALIALPKGMFHWPSLRLKSGISGGRGQHGCGRQPVRRLAVAAPHARPRSEFRRRLAVQGECQGE